jgi:hypothetical protein
LSLLPKLLVATGRNTDDAPEARGKVALATPARGVGDLSEGYTLMKQGLRVAHSHAFEIVVRRHSCGTMKHAHQMEGAEVDVGGEIGQAYSLCVMRFQIGTRLRDSARLVTGKGKRHGIGGVALDQGREQREPAGFARERRLFRLQRPVSRLCWRTLDEWVCALETAAIMASR